MQDITQHLFFLQVTQYQPGLEVRLVIMHDLKSFSPFQGKLDRKLFNMFCPWWYCCGAYCLWICFIYLSCHKGLMRRFFAYLFQLAGYLKFNMFLSRSCRLPPGRNLPILFFLFFSKIMLRCPGFSLNCCVGLQVTHLSDGPK